MKKFLSILLSLLMIFSCVSVALAAGEEEIELVDFSAELAKKLMDDNFTTMLNDVSIPQQIKAVTGQTVGNDIDALRAAGRLNNVNLLGLTVKDLYDANTVAWTSDYNADPGYPTASWSGTNASSNADDLTIATHVAFSAAVHARIAGFQLATSQSGLNKSAAFKSLYTSGSSFDLSFGLKAYGYTDSALQANTTYYYRFYLVSDDGEYTGATYTFTTGDDAFTVASAGVVSGTTATFKSTTGIDHAASGNMRVGYLDFALLYGEMNDYLRRVLDSKFNNLQFYNAANATKITNFVGHLLFPNYEDVTVTFSQNYVKAGTFYKAIGLYSGLTEYLTSVWFQPKWEEAPLTDSAGRYAYTVIDAIDQHLTMYVSTTDLRSDMVIVIGGKTYRIDELKEEKNGVYYYSAYDNNNQKVTISAPAGKINIRSTLTIDGKTYSIAEQQTTIQQATDFNGNRLYEPKVNFASVMNMLQVDYNEMSAPEAQINRPADVASFFVRGVIENAYTIGPIKYLVQTVQSWLMMHATTCFPAVEALFKNWIDAGKITSAQLKTYEGFLNLVSNGNDAAATDKLQFIKVPAEIMLLARDEAECFLYLLLYLNLLGNNKNNPNVVATMKSKINSNTSLNLKSETKKNLCSYLDAMLLGEYRDFSQRIVAIATANISFAESDAKNTFIDFCAKVIKNFWNFFDKIFRKIDFMHILIK